MARTAPGTGVSSLWLIEFSRGILSKFTTSTEQDGSPVWSPDGGRIIFLSGRDGPLALYLKHATGSAPEQLLIRHDNALIPFDWSRDGRFLLYGESMPATRFDLWIAPLSGAQKPYPFLRTVADELEGQFSPDGQWIAYTSDETGRDEIYVQPAMYEAGQAGRSGQKWQVSSQGGAQPHKR